MSEPVDLSVERERRRPEAEDLRACASCGCVWFRTAVVIQQNGHVSGYDMEEIACTQCGANPYHDPDQSRDR